MKKFLIILLCILAIILCWYYFMLDEKERLLLNISNDKIGHLNSFKEFPIEFDTYEVFLASNKSNEDMGELIVIDEKWIKEDDELSVEVKLYSSFFKESQQTLLSNVLEEDYYKKYFKEFEIVNVLNHKGYYKNFKHDNTIENPEKILYTYYEELFFDLDGITYRFYILRKSPSNSIESYGADKLIDMFFTNNFKK